MAESEPRASSRIFISYRREDSMGFVIALVPLLQTRFGRNRIFQDLDNIPPGQDFLRAIQRELESCKVLLAVIGNEWTTVQDARTGKRRLDNPSDILRIEISAALKNEQITVIPVLVDRAAMPRPEDLPDDLSDLTRRNAFELSSDARWNSDVERLARAIDEICEAPQQPRAEASASGFERLELKRKRQLTEHLKVAREAFEAEDYQAVLAACERAVWLDPQNPEARDLAARAHAAIDQKSIQQRLDQAARALSDGDLATASEAIDHALARSPDNPTAIKLRQDLLRARSERERQAELTRQTAAELASAQSSLDDEDFPAAMSHVEEALTLAPESREALDLKEKIVAARAESLRLRDLKRRAHQAVADAQTAWAAGKRDEALEQLSAFSPPHELVSKALEELRAKATDTARLTAAAEAEAAALARRDADAKLVLATAAVGEKRYEAAQHLIDEARQIDPAHPDLPAWGKRIADAIAADTAAEQARRNREAKAAHEAAERQATLAREAAARARRDASAKLALAAAAVKDKRYDAARELVESARQIDAGHPDLPVWVTRIADAIAADVAAEQARREREAQAAREEAERQAALATKAAERARRDADAKLALAAAAIEDKRYDAAEKFVDAARLVEPGHPQLAEYATRISDAIAADVAAEQARQEREAEVAREKAVAAKEAADRARRNADEKLALAGAAIDAKRYDAAKKLVAAARVIHPGHPDLASWTARIRDAIESDAAAERSRKADQTHTAREAEDQPLHGEAKAGPRPAWITYLAAAAAVLVVAIIAGSFLLRTDPPAVTDPSPPSTSGDTQVPAPPAEPPIQPDLGKGSNTGADPGSKPPAGRGTVLTGETKPSTPESPRDGTDVKPTPTAKDVGTSPAPAVRTEKPTSPIESPPVVREPDPPKPSPADPPVSADPPKPSPPVAKVDPIAEAERQDIAQIRKLLDAYEAAYEALDDGRLKAIDPMFKGIPSKMLIKKVTVTFRDPRIVVVGPQATVLAPATYLYEWNRAGNPAKSESRSLSWNLQKDGSRWRVVSSN